MDLMGTSVQPPTAVAPAPPSPAPLKFGETIHIFNEGLLRSLAELSMLDRDSKSNLVVPARTLLYFGGFIVLSSITLRIMYRIFSYGDFLASLIAGCLLLLTSVGLFVYQYRTEQLKATAVVQITKEFGQKLVATLGPASR